MLLARDASDCDIGSVGAVGSVTSSEQLPDPLCPVYSRTRLGGARLFFDVHSNDI